MSDLRLWAQGQGLQGEEIAHSGTAADLPITGRQAKRLVGGRVVTRLPEPFPLNRKLFAKRKTDQVTDNDVFKLGQLTVILCRHGHDEMGAIRSKVTLSCEQADLTFLGVEYYRPLVGEVLAQLLQIFAGMLGRDFGFAASRCRFFAHDVLVSMVEGDVVGVERLPQRGPSPLPGRQV
jgi:hypothetical protein